MAGSRDVDSDAFDDVDAVVGAVVGAVVVSDAVVAPVLTLRGATPTLPGAGSGAGVCLR